MKTTLTKSDWFYLEQHGDKLSDGELATDLKVKPDVISKARKKIFKSKEEVLANLSEEEKKEKDKQDREAKAKIGRFATQAGTVSMTNSQSTADDDVAKGENAEWKAKYSKNIGKCFPDRP